MNQLKEELKEAQDEGDEYQKKLMDANKTIDALKIGIYSIYKSLGWGNETVQILSGKLLNFLKMVIFRFEWSYWEQYDAVLGCNWTKNKWIARDL